MYLQAELSTVMIMFFSMQLFSRQKGCYFFLKHAKLYVQITVSESIITHCATATFNASVVRGTVTFERQTLKLSHR